MGWKDNGKVTADERKKQYIRCFERTLETYLKFRSGGIRLMLPKKVDRLSRADFCCDVELVIRSLADTVQADWTALTTADPISIPLPKGRYDSLACRLGKLFQARNIDSRTYFQRPGVSVRRQHEQEEFNRMMQQVRELGD
jgi:hypothetical protein